MDILILGGTRFLGRCVVEGALDRSHRVSVVEELRGDRGDVRFTWMPEKFFLDTGVELWTELPFWVPEEMAGILSASVDKAVGAGMVFRPLAETVRDAIAWDVRREGPPGMGAGMTQDREGELLRSWRGATL